MNVDFPNTPEVDDIFTVDDRSWRWTGSVWESVTTTTEGPEYTAGSNISLDGDQISVVSSPDFSTIRLTSTTDTDLSSTGHAFQIGASTAANLTIDNNEILARNNSGNSNLSLNTKGGSVTIGDSGSIVTVNGTFVAPVSSATQTALNLKANIDSPTFTGTPLSTTAAANDNSTQIATTAYVVGQAATAAPLVDGTAAVGNSLRYARENHVHPVDTSRAPITSPTFTGLVTTNNGITNAQQKNALVVSGYNSASGLFAHSSRVVMSAVASGSANPTTRPDGTALQAGDVWISF